VHHHQSNPKALGCASRYIHNRGAGVVITCGLRTSKKVMPGQ